MEPKELLLLDLAGKHQQASIRLLDVALDAFCKVTGLDANAVRHYVAAPEPEPQELGTPEVIEVETLVDSWPEMAGACRTKTL